MADDEKTVPEKLSEEFDGTPLARDGVAVTRYQELSNEADMRLAFEILDSVDETRKGLEAARDEEPYALVTSYEKLKKKYDKAPDDDKPPFPGDSIDDYIERKVATAAASAHAKADVISSYVYNLLKGHRDASH